MVKIVRLLLLQFFSLQVVIPVSAWTTRSTVSPLYHLIKKDAHYHIPMHLFSYHGDEYTNHARAWIVEADGCHLSETVTTQSKRHDLDFTEPMLRFSSITADASEQQSILYSQARQAAILTWNWCAHFVAEYNLCPWAMGSVQSREAIRIYIVSMYPNRESHMDEMIFAEAVLKQVTASFIKDLQGDDLDRKTAITFVILSRIPSRHAAQLDRPNDSWYDDFPSFYDWFLDLEERWQFSDQVTLAPFHPEWRYAEQTDDPIELEKQSPFATISLVSTATVEKAGEVATAQIAAHNQDTLQERSYKEWKTIYKGAIEQNDQ